MSKIFLTGFMGSGKSTLGKSLAALLEYDFADLDDEIEKSEQATIREIFLENGEDYFREKESAFLKSFSGFSRTVVATGGGTPCFFDNMEWMNQQGLTIYLRMKPAIIGERMQAEKHQRPLLAEYSNDEMLNFIFDKMEERKLFYEQAKLIVEADFITAEDLLVAVTDYGINE